MRELGAEHLVHRREGRVRGDRVPAQRQLLGVLVGGDVGLELPQVPLEHRVVGERVPNADGAAAAARRTTSIRRRSTSGMPRAFIL